MSAQPEWFGAGTVLSSRATGFCLHVWKPGKMASKTLLQSENKGQEVVWISLTDVPVNVLVCRSKIYCKPFFLCPTDSFCPLSLLAPNSWQSQRWLLHQAPTPGRAGCQGEPAPAPGAPGRGEGLHHRQRAHQAEREIQDGQDTHTPPGLQLPLQDLGSQRPVPEAASVHKQGQARHGRPNAKWPADHPEPALLGPTAILHNQQQDRSNCLSLFSFSFFFFFLNEIL